MEQHPSGRVTRESNPSNRRAVLQRALLGFVPIAIFVWALPQFADYTDVWQVVTGVSPAGGLALFAATVLSFATAWSVMVAILPGATYRQAMIANQASTAVANTVPGGGALGVGVTFALYSSWGFSRSDISLAVLLSGIWKNLVILAMPLLALSISALRGDTSPSLVAAAGVGTVVLGATVTMMALTLKSRSLAFRAGVAAARLVSIARRMFHQPPVDGWGPAIARFRERAANRVGHRWLHLSLATIASQAALFIVLLVSLRAVGIHSDEISWTAVLAGFAVVRLLSALPLTPGAAGVAELGYVTVLTLSSQVAARTQIVAAVLLFRALTFLLPIHAGLIAYLYWKRTTLQPAREKQRQTGPRRRHSIADSASLGSALSTKRTRPNPGDTDPVTPSRQP